MQCMVGSLKWGPPGWGKYYCGPYCDLLKVGSKSLLVLYSPAPGKSSLDPSQLKRLIPARTTRWSETQSLTGTVYSALT